MMVLMDAMMVLMDAVPQGEWAGQLKKVGY
jgi:hypothetical protein